MITVKEYISAIRQLNNRNLDFRPKMGVKRTMFTIGRYIHEIEEIEDWQNPELKQIAMNRLDEAHKNTALTDAQFAETYQFRVITEMLPPILRSADCPICTENADECANSKDLSSAIGNANKASKVNVCVGPRWATESAYWAIQHDAIYAAFDAPIYAPDDRKDAVLKQYVDLMVDILTSSKP